MRAKKYVQRTDGERFTVPNGEPYRLACCDCGLVHDFAFTADGQEIQVEATRNNRATAARRYGMLRRQGYTYAPKRAAKSTRGTRSDRLFAELRCLRLDDGRDPFAEFAAGRVSKGWLLARVVGAVRAVQREEVSAHGLPGLDQRRAAGPRGADAAGEEA